MKISVNWLKDYIELDESPDQIARILDKVGFPVEGIEQVDDDTVLDVEITSNRGDCLSHIGIARELASATGSKLKLPEIILPESDKQAADMVSVEIDQPDLCGRYTARVIEGVKVGQSPAWMKKRLGALGIRSVNNIVDATNYAMMETGQPPHAFDFDKLRSGKIIVRKAKQGEKIVSIDETKCGLTENMLIIADADVPIAIAGVMGGLETEISNSTTTLLLEDAHFAPLTVRQTSRALGIFSESSYRFERNIDIAMIDWASRRTAQLITTVAGGKVAAGVVDVFPAGYEGKIVSMRLSRMKALLGIDIPIDSVMSILTSLGLNPSRKGDAVECIIPTWRRTDLKREVDIIEEVIRVYGYDKIHTNKKINIEVVGVDPMREFAARICSLLNSSGYYETINVTFTDDAAADLFTESGSVGHLAVKDVSRKNANLLRQTLLGSLMTNLKANVNAGNVECRIYELANTFTKQKTGHTEAMKIAMLCESDFRQLRGAVEALLRNINRNASIEFKSCNLKWAGAAAEIYADNKSIGVIGAASDKLIDGFDLKNATPVLAELDFDTLMALQSGPAAVKPLPRFPAIVRDLSIIVDEQTAWSQIDKAIHSCKTSELEKVSFVDIYRGKPIVKGKKSVTLSLQFRDEDGTLTHEQVDIFEKKIVDSLSEKVNAELRTA